MIPATPFSLNRPSQWAVLLSLLAAILFIRVHELLLLPTLAVDDGANVFSYFYQHRGFREILSFKSGYIPLLPNILAYAVLRLPTQAVPYAMAWIPFCLSILTCALFFAARYRAVLPSDKARAALCLLFALAPVSQHPIIASTDFSIWNAFILLILLSVRPLPAGKRRKALTFAAIGLLAWSHPLTLVTAPLLMFWFMKDRPNRLLYAVMLANLSLHQIFGVQNLGRVMRFLDESGGGSGLIGSLALALQSLGHIAARTLLGPLLYRWALASAPWLTPLAVSAILLASLLMARKYRALRLPFLFLLLAAFSVTLLNILARGTYVGGACPTPHRYIYIQSLAVLAWLVLMAASGLRPAPPDGPRWKAALSPVLLLSFLIWNSAWLAVDLRDGRTRSPTVRANGLAVRDFFRQLQLEEVNRGGTEGIFLLARKTGDFPFMVDTRDKPIAAWRDSTDLGAPPVFQSQKRYGFKGHAMNVLGFIRG